MLWEVNRENEWIEMEGTNTVKIVNLFSLPVGEGELLSLNTYQVCSENRFMWVAVEFSVVQPGQAFLEFSVLRLASMFERGGFFL